MGDFYSEKLVKKKTGAKELTIKAGLIFLTAVAILSIFMTMFGMILFILMIGLDILISRRLDIEYEYQYINGDLDVDKIMHKERRKNLFSTNVREMELLAPSGDPRLDVYKDAQVLDYTSGEDEAPTYELIAVKEGVKYRLCFEPDEEMVEEIWMRSPSKVIRRR